MIKSQSDLNTCNNGKRDSEVLLETIKKCEELQKENAELKEQLAEHKEYCCCQKNEVLLLEKDKLQKTLDIAVKALRTYSNLLYDHTVSGYEGIAKKALKEMGEE